MYKPIHQKIHHWYAIHGRTELPWRNSDDPYEIYISEVMLQQTQVKTILDRYYFPFLQKFPTLQALASASLDEVLKAWEGLGYYNRAKHLHACAQQIDTLPQTLETLQKLPGIGPNTAHAICAFAFKQSVPVMEANVKRILSRLFALSTPNSKALWEKAYALLDHNNPFDYNQAMMDIGALICTPTQPKCDQCPLNSICQGKDSPTLYPIKKRKQTPQRVENILIYRYQDRLSLTQRTDRFLHGLWGLPSVKEIPKNAQTIGEVSHAYTHFKLLCHIYLLNEKRATQEHYFSLEEIVELAISKVDEKIVKQLKRSHL